jgi:TRAP-type C4-dicarboxylate transport system substrate-binding protein
VKGLSRSLFALVAAAVLTVGLAACGDSDSGSESTGPVKLRLGYVTTPQHPYGVSVDSFAKEVATASNGAMTVETVPNYTGGDAQLFDDVSGGTIEMGAISTAIYDTKGSNVFQALQAPFLITNYGLAGTVEGGSIGQSMLDNPNGPAKFGTVGLGILEGGLRKPLGRTVALKNPTNFKGKKIRAPQSQVLSATITALGAEPVALPVGDVYGALQNGTVDGMEANLGLIYTNKYYEVADFVTQNVNLWPFPAAVVINKEQFDKLSSDQQAILTTAGKNLNKASIAVFTDPNPPVNFVTELCKAGLTFAFASDSDIKALNDASETAMTELQKDSEVADYIKQIQDAKTAAGTPPAPAPLPAGCKKA